MVSPVTARSGGQQGDWPVQSGPLPPLADGYITRPETAPDLDAVLLPGTTVMLIPSQAGRAEPGACGKTQLAVAFAEKLRQSRQVDLLVWVCAASRTSVLTGYAAAAAATGTGSSGPADSAAASFVSWLSGTSRPWAVVLDDVHDGADLAGLWPEGRAGRVLVTTAQGAGLAGGGRHPLVVPVGSFSAREAMDYLMGRLSADPDQRLGAIDLVEDLGGEPLALAQASSVIASSELSCREYQEIFARRRQQLSDSAGGAATAASVTWTISADHASRLSPAGSVRPLLALVALLDGQAIPGTALTAPAALEYLAGGDAGAADPLLTWGSLQGLERAGLLSVDPATAPPTIRISRGVQHAIRAAAPGDLLARAARAAADALLQMWPDGEPGDPVAWPASGLLACAASLQRVSGQALWHPGGPHPLLLRAGHSLDSGRLAGSAVGYWTELAAASDRILGASSPDTFTAGSHLAAALASDGQVAEAVSWARWVLAGRARVLGEDDPQTNEARVSLGRALIAFGEPAEAVDVMEAAAAGLARTLGTDHADTLSARDELGSAYTAAGRRKDAIELYKRTLADRERVQGTDHPDTVAARQRLADAHPARGRR